MTHAANATEQTINALRATIAGLRSWREEITAELMDAPHSRGTAWHDARANEVQSLSRSIRARMVTLDDMMDGQGDDSGVDQSINDTLDAHELMDESIRTDSGAVAYRDDTSADRDERWVVLSGDSVLGAGRTASAAWDDAGLPMPCRTAYGPR